jgi:putative Ca2+/H+ antiporter (TMEM165/GDT1 family)
MEKTITLNDEQLGEILREARKKAIDGVVIAQFVASILLAVVGGFFSSSIGSDQMLIASTTVFILVGLYLEVTT